jgi:hypothetical protein
MKLRRSGIFDSAAFCILRICPLLAGFRYEALGAVEGVETMLLLSCQFGWRQVIGRDALGDVVEVLGKASIERFDGGFRLAE